MSVFAQSKEIAMLNLTRRNALLTAACAGAAFGLPKPVSFIEATLAQKGPEAGKGFRPFKFGKVQGFILNDGVWEKPHDPGFIKNASVEETKAALAAAGMDGVCARGSAKTLNARASNELRSCLSS
jgi:hypothetical protein